MKIVRQLGNLKVALGSGKGEVQGTGQVNTVCIMQAAWMISHYGKDLADGKYEGGVMPSDQPDCVHPALRAFAISLNDALGDSQRDRLWGFLPRLMGTDVVSDEVVAKWDATVAAYNTRAGQVVGQGPKALYEDNSQYAAEEGLTTLHEMLRMGEEEIGEVNPKVAEYEVRVAKRVAESFAPVAKV
jgi:hypothetical protein